jgi:hypothetical protein
MKLRFASSSLTAVLAAVGLLTAGRSLAAPVQINFTGTLEALIAPAGLFDGSAAPGDDVSGSYAFDTDNYASFGAGSGLTLQLGSYTFQPDFLAATLIQLTDESGIGTDNFNIVTSPESISSTNPGASPLFNGSASLSLTGDASVLSGPSLDVPALTQPTMGDWLWGTLSFSAQDGGGDMNLLGIVSINTLSVEAAAVPEPGALGLLAGAAVVGAAFLRRRR